MLKVISKVKVFQKWVKLQGLGHRVKYNGTLGKVLSQGILMWNIKALALTVQKLLARVKFSKNNGSRSRSQGKWKKEWASSHTPRSNIAWECCIQWMAIPSISDGQQTENQFHLSCTILAKIQKGYKLLLKKI